MKKMSTLFKKDPYDLGRVVNDINPDNEWVFTDVGVKATQKFDGTACAIINGLLYKRYDVKKGKSVPEGAIPCQDPDPITGHWPHWLLCSPNKSEDKYFFEGFLNTLTTSFIDGTYELCGPKIQGNPERFDQHVLIKHGIVILGINFTKYTFDMFKNYLQYTPIEGIVFHHPDGRMCKLRKSDFGFKRTSP